MRWMIAADSSCDLKQMDTGSPDILYDSVPFVITADGRQFVDEVDLDVPELVSAFEASSSSSSACPSPLSWQELFQKADRVIALTISGRLSGSFNSAMVGKAMALEADPNKKIEVIDSLATGPKLVLLAQHALRQIQDQMSFEAVCASCRSLASSARTVFTLNSFHNLLAAFLLKVVRFQFGNILSQGLGGVLFQDEGVSAHTDLFCLFHGLRLF